MPNSAKRALVGALLGGGLLMSATLLAGGTLAACSAGKSPTAHAGPAPNARLTNTSTPPPVNRTSNATSKSAQPTASAQPAAQDGGQHNAAALLRQRALAAAQCDTPTSVIERPPEQGVVFNNAMTSVDAGFIDRTQGILDAIQTKDTPLRCCFDAAGTAGEIHLMVDMTLAPDGTVQRAAIDKSQSSKSTDILRACVTAVLRDNGYPASPTGKETIVNYLLKIRHDAP